MSADPDLLAIQRQRRQQRRCLRCGVPTPRAALCPACRRDWRYCPRCEGVYSARDAAQRDSAAGRTTAYCKPCASRVRHGHDRTYAVCTAARQAHMHDRLSAVVALYRAGLTYDEIAARLATTHSAITNLVTRARKRHSWPPDCRRIRRRNGRKRMEPNTPTIADAIREALTSCDMLESHLDAIPTAEATYAALDRIRKALTKELANVERRLLRERR